MIEDFNPWWTSREGVEEVEIYRRYAESEVRWRPDLIDRLSLRPFSLNFVFGPKAGGQIHGAYTTGEGASGEGRPSEVCFLPLLRRDCGLQGARRGAEDVPKGEEG